MNSWPIACATKNYTSDTVIKFFEDDIIVALIPPIRIVSDNEPAIIEAYVQSFWKNTYWSGGPFFTTL